MRSIGSSGVDIILLWAHESVGTVRAWKLYMTCVGPAMFLVLLLTLNILVRPSCVVFYRPKQHLSTSGVGNCLFLRAQEWGIKLLEKKHRCKSPGVCLGGEGTVTTRIEPCITKLLHKESLEQRWSQQLNKNIGKNTVSVSWNVHGVKMYFTCFGQINQGHPMMGSSQIH